MKDIPFRDDHPFPRQRLFDALHAATGHSYEGYRSEPFQRAISHRMERQGHDDLEAYLQLLEQDTDEAQALERDALVGMTAFFRHPEAFKALEKQIASHLLTSRNDTPSLQVWVPGCSTGQEAYSLAILLAELQQRLAQPFSFQVAGSDLNADAIQHAQRGLYEPRQMQSLSTPLCERHFSTHSEVYEICDRLRQQTLFFVHDVLSPPPFQQIDLISCRNLLIYLRPLFKQRILTTFSKCLSPGGLLFLGVSENAHQAPDRFTRIDDRHRIYTCP